MGTGCNDFVRRLDDGPKPAFQVGHLERLPLNTPYPQIVSHVMRQMTRPPLAGKAELVIDYTGVGRPVFDLFCGRGVSPIGVTITGGDGVTNDGPVWRVAKLILISRVQALLHSRQLKIHKTLPDAPALVAELQDFRAEVTDLGNWKFGARSGKRSPSPVGALMPAMAKDLDCSNIRASARTGYGMVNERGPGAGVSTHEGAAWNQRLDHRRPHPRC